MSIAYMIQGWALRAEASMQTAVLPLTGSVAQDEFSVHADNLGPPSVM